MTREIVSHALYTKLCRDRLDQPVLPRRQRAGDIKYRVNGSACDPLSGWDCGWSSVCVCVCVHRACVRAYICACACMRACVHRTCVCVCVCLCAYFSHCQCQQISPPLSLLPPSGNLLITRYRPSELYILCMLKMPRLMHPLKTNGKPVGNE